MTILSKVCAEFHDRAGEILFTVRPGDLLRPMEVPDSICQDPLFGMLVRDGSISVPGNKEELKQLENDPEAVPAAEEKKPAAKAKAKPDSPAEEKPAAAAGKESAKA